MNAGLLDYPAIRNRKIVGSRATLHRLLTRPEDENPFPRPLRHTVTGRRYWRVEDVDAWREREAERPRQGIAAGTLVPDTDPARWTPCRRKVEGLL